MSALTADEAAQVAAYRAACAEAEALGLHLEGPMYRWVTPLPEALARRVDWS